MTDFGFGEFELSVLQDDFTPEAYDDDISQYEGNEEKFTAYKKIIITYKQGQEGLLREILGIEEGAPLKVIYKADELAR